MDSTFYGCSGITNITLPNSLITIGEHVFGATGLTEITIPNGVTSIGYEAFVECTNLTNVTFLGKTLAQV